MAAQPDGRILVGGNFETVNGVPARGLVRLNRDGSVDATFNVGTGVTGGQSITGGVYAITLQQDGRILIGGDFTVVDGGRVLNPASILPSVFDPSCQSTTSVGRPNCCLRRFEPTIRLWAMRVARTSGLE